MNFERKKQLSMGVIFSYLSIVFKIISGIIYTPIILHALGQSEYGIYSLCTSFFGYLTILNVGMNAAYIRFYVQSKEKGDYSVETINGIFLKIFSVLGIVGLFVGLLISKNAMTFFGNRILQDEYKIFKKSLMILSLTALVYSLNCVFSSCIIAHEQFVVGKLFDLLHAVLAPLITIPFLLSGFKSITIVAVEFFITALMLIANGFYAVFRLKMRFDISHIDYRFLRSVALFAGFIVIQSIMDQFNWQIDKLILARVRGASDVAIYSVGSMLNTHFITIAGSAAVVFITEINRLAAKNNDKAISDLFVRTSRLFSQIAVLIMSGFIILGKPFIKRWSGSEYLDSYYVGILIMLPMTVALSQGLGQDIARAKNMHKIQILINVSVSFMNFLVSIPLAQKYGAIGSALGTFGSEVIICIFVQSLYYHKKVRLNMKEYYCEMLKLIPGWLIPFAVGGLLMVFKLVHPTYGSVFLYGILYTIIYTVSVWNISFSEREKGYVKSILNKVVNGRKRS